MEEEVEFTQELAGKDIDKYLDMINPPGKIGRYQFALFMIVGLICSSALALSFLAVYFGYTPPHHCKGDNISLIPDEYKLASCSMYSNLTSNATNETHPTSCENGWSYDRSQYRETFVSEFDLVCDKSVYFETILTISSILGGLATPVISYLADRYGRRKVFIISFTIDRLASFGFALIPNLPVVSVIMGIASLSAGEIIPVLIMYECFPMRYRGLGGTAINMIWIVFACLLPLSGHLVRDWRMLILTWNIPVTVLGVIGFIFIPESLTWLMSNRKFDEAEKLIRKIAKCNKITLPESLWNEKFLMKKNESKASADAAADDDDDNRGVGKRVQKKKTYHLQELLHSSRIMKITVVMSGLYMINCIIYSGLLYITPTLVGDMHLNIFYMSIVELPAYVIAVFVVPKFGRKWPTIGFMFIAGIGLLFSLIELIKFETSQLWIQITTALIGKFGIAGSYAVIYVYGPELFPTNLRSTGVAVCRLSEIIGSILVPYSSFHLVKYGNWIPRVLYGFLAIFMAIPIFTLPETNDKPLPESIREIEQW